MNRFLPLLLVILVLLLSSCSERSEYGEASDYEKFGAGSTDTTAPTISSVSPTDNSTYNSPATTIAVTFSETISTSSITTNTSDTTCSGSFQLSSDNFATCIKMSATPSASDNATTFTATPTDNLSGGTTFKLRITTSAKDSSSNSLASAYTTNGFTTSPYGSGTIKGTVRYDNGTGVDNVSVSFAKSGTTGGNTTTADNGTYSQDNLSLGVYNIAFTKSDYLTTSQSDTLATDNQTITANVTILAANCSAGTISGTISDAVSGSAVSGVSLSVRSGLNVTSGSTTGTTATTATNGTYTLSSNMTAGGYTVQVSKTGYITTYFNVNVCSTDLTNQDASMSEELSSGTMRIVLSWPLTSPVTGDDLDSHISIPNSAGNGTVHIYYGTNAGGVNANDYYVYGANDNVTLDKDDQNGPPGTETITITQVRSGTYSFSVHDWDNGDADNPSSTKLAESGASVKVYYNNTTTTFNVPNSAGTLWRVFTFTTSGGLSTTGTMTHQSTPGSVY